MAPRINRRTGPADLVEFMILQRTVAALAIAYREIVSMRFQHLALHTTGLVGGYS
jgi:hypothetical protein